MQVSDQDSYFGEAALVQQLATVQLDQADGTKKYFFTIQP